MNGLFARIRRSRDRGARYVAAVVSMAYLATGLAPCLAAASAAASEAGVHLDGHSPQAQLRHAAHADEQGHQTREAASAQHHGHGHHAAAPMAHVVDEPVPQRTHCPHCLDGLPSGAALAHDGAPATCSVAAAITDVAAMKTGDTPPAQAVPILAPARFALPPPLGPPLARPAHLVERAPSVALNVRHCVFLI